VFGDQLRLKAALSVPWNLNGQLTKLTLERLLALAITGVAIEVGDRCIFVMPKVLGGVLNFV
jgi:hypothetical protein